MLLYVSCARFGAISIMKTTAHSRQPGERFCDHLHACLLGIAIGDGMGAPVEGLTSTEIARRFPTWDWNSFLPTQEWAPKGHGRITDDTLMTEALMRAYSSARGHLDAFGFRDHLLPEMCETRVWVPELQREMPIIERLNNIERYTLIRLRHVGIEPRIAGVGNILNCGIAMFIMPVGAVNAGDPRAAYHEAAELGMAEGHCFAVEGAATLAAAYAAALGARSTIDKVITATMDLARDGTAAAIDACCAATDPEDSLPTWIERVLQAVMPYTNCMHDGEPGGRKKSVSRNLPDPRRCFEEVPVALAALRYGQGNFLTTLEAACRFGRDADSIAGMACGLCGAIGGGTTIPAGLNEASQAANDRDWLALSRDFAATCAQIREQDCIAWKARMEAWA